MSFVRVVKISLAFVGLLVGAGFATGKEVVQYFISFGITGLWGAVLAGVVMAVAGAVILQLGSYFLASEHNFVFKNVSHPIVSKILDYSVVFTLFCVGVVMLAGAGATLEQQFGWPAWMGSGLMLLIVMFTGLLDVDKVSSIISMITPLIIIAVIGAFIYMMFNIPDDISAVGEIAHQQESPVSPWFLSALNYNGLALMLGVSMCLVIGGNYANPREVGMGGLVGGIIYTVMLLMAAVTMLFAIEKVEGSDVPMLALFESIHPTLAMIMVWIIFATVYNTCIGMFYSLGRRLTVNHPQRYNVVFLVMCVIGYGISFVGFDALMTYVYPVIGYLGMLMIVVMVAWWVKNRGRIVKESELRQDIQDLVEREEDDNETFEASDEKELKSKLEESDMDNTEEAIRKEVARENGDSSEKDSSDDESDEDDSADKSATSEPVQSSEASKPAGSSPASK